MRVLIIGATGLLGKALVEERDLDLRRELLLAGIKSV